MARSNKYASVNFNEIYGPKASNSSPTPTGSASMLAPLSNPQNSNFSAVARTQGRMLILTRPAKPQTQPSAPAIDRSAPNEKPPSAISPSETDRISLRPLGGGATKEAKESPPLMPGKPQAFVPPHLRPGFAGREERPDQEVQRERQGFSRARPDQARSGGGGGDGEGRPRSGGGHDGVRRGGSSDLERNRPLSSGSRPGSSGRNGSYRSPLTPPDRD